MMAEPTDTIPTPSKEPRRNGNDLTAEYVRSILAYEPNTGAFSWLIPKRGRRKTVGSFNKVIGYHMIGIDGRIYYAHRIAYLWMVGVWPPDLVDHKERDKIDNRWKLIRPATNSQNSANAIVSCRNKLGIKGVVQHVLPKGGVRYRAYIAVGKKSKYLGSHRTPEAAAAAYMVAAKAAFGEFARGYTRL